MKTLEKFIFIKKKFQQINCILKNTQNDLQKNIAIPI